MHTNLKLPKIESNFQGEKFTKKWGKGKKMKQKSQVLQIGEKSAGTNNLAPQLLHTIRRQGQEY
jgi:hypothetical protein